MSTPRLSFRAGRFRLAEVPESLHLRLSKNAHWRCVARGVYETVNLREAASFRCVADAGVEKILNRTFQAHYDLPRMPPLPELDPHQREGLKWALERKRSYLAHAPGAGKTAQAILAGFLAEGLGRVLLIVPPSLTVNWEREVMKVTGWLGEWPAIGVVPASSRADTMAWGADFIICPDSMLTKPWVYEKLSGLKWRLIAVDEASRFKEPTSERSLAFFGGRNGEKSYPGIFRDARHVVFLDGSPMPNRPIELWGPTYALHPEAIDCMDRDDFGYRYCGARPNERGVWEYNYSSHEAELQSKLQKDFMHVVPEDRLSHPERLRSLVFVDDVRSPEHKTWERGTLSAIPANVDSLGEDASQGELARYRRELGIRKIPMVARYVRERLEEKNESILLFAWHRDVCEGLAGELARFKPGVIMGGVTAHEREACFGAFQAGRTKLLILNIAAGGRGHNLQKASRVVFAEYSWTDELNRQCEKRASRRGSEETHVRCDYLVVSGSFDEKVLASIFTKERRVKRIIG